MDCCRRRLACCSIALPPGSAASRPARLRYARRGGTPARPVVRRPSLDSGFPHPRTRDSQDGGVPRWGRRSTVRPRSTPVSASSRGSFAVLS